MNAGMRHSRPAALLAQRCDRRSATRLLGAPFEVEQVLCPRREKMAIWTGHCHLLSARFLAVALGVGSHLPTLGTRCAPIPLADFCVELFGRHLNLPCAPLPQT